MKCQNCLQLFTTAYDCEKHDCPAVLPVGEKHDQDKIPVQLIPPEALMEIGRVLKFGAEKYSANSWQGLFNDDGESRYIGAALRHLYAHQSGEMNDPESGMSHLSHAGTCLLFLIWNDVQRQPIQAPPQAPPIVSPSDDGYVPF